VHVGKEGDVRHRVAIPGEEVALSESLVQDSERGVADRLAPLDLAAAGPDALRDEAEAEAGDARDHLGLLEEEPAQGLRALVRVLRQVLRALREVDEDGVGLAERLGAVLLEDGRLPDGVDPGVVVGEGVAAEDVDGDALVGKAELGEEQPDLVAVGGGGVVVQAEGHDGFNA
jgi:hypothetical protein